MQTLKTLLILALLASSDSYRQSRRYKGKPRSYKPESECEDVVGRILDSVCVSVCAGDVVLNGEGTQIAWR